MDETQDMRKKTDLMQGGITTKDLGTQKMLVELKYITTHLVIQPRIFMHLKSQGVSQKCLPLGIKEEDINWTT
jgi:hypothetical protein